MNSTANNDAAAKNNNVADTCQACLVLNGGRRNTPATQTVTEIPQVTVYAPHDDCDKMWPEHKTMRVCDHCADMDHFDTSFRTAPIFAAVVSQ